MLSCSSKDSRRWEVRHLFLWEERFLPTIPVRAKVTRMKVGLYMHDALF